MTSGPGNWTSIVTARATRALRAVLRSTSWTSCRSCSMWSRGDGLVVLGRRSGATWTVDRRAATGDPVPCAPGITDPMTVQLRRGGRRELLGAAAESWRPYTSVLLPPEGPGVCALRAGRTLHGDLLLVAKDSLVRCAQLKVTIGHGNTGIWMIMNNKNRDKAGERRWRTGDRVESAGRRPPCAVAPRGEG